MNLSLTERKTLAKFGGYSDYAKLILQMNKAGNWVWQWGGDYTCVQKLTLQIQKLIDYGLLEHIKFKPEQIRITYEGRRFICTCHSNKGKVWKEPDNLESDIMVTCLDCNGITCLEEPK